MARPRLFVPAFLLALVMIAPGCLFTRKSGDVTQDPKTVYLKQRAAKANVNPPAGVTYPDLTEDINPTLQEQEVRIPKIIHQIWHAWTPGSKPSALAQAWTAELKRLHPASEGWTYMHWDNDNSLELVKTRYPEYLSLYQGYVEPIKRTDSIRFFILKTFGGVYVDMHFKPIKNLVPLLRGQTFVVAEHNPDAHEMNNAFMASIPDHPILSDLIKDLASAQDQHVIWATGPIFLSNHVVAFNKNLSSFSVGVFKRKYLYPTGWWEPEISSPEQQGCLNTVDPVDKRGCIRSYPDAFLVKKAVSSWGSQFPPKK